MSSYNPENYTVVAGNSNALTRKIACQGAHPNSPDTQEIHLFYVG